MNTTLAAPTSPKWLQKDGYTISLSDMTDTHLHNAVKVVQRRIASLAYSCTSSIPDEADFALAQDVAEATDPYEEMLQALEAEITRRHATPA